MKAIIHIGTEKTGTTTIQEFLNLNREKLLQQNIAYLKTPGLRNQRNLAVYAMTLDNIDNFIRAKELLSNERRREWCESFFNTFQEEITSLDPSVQCVIFSSEHFHSRLKSTEEVFRLRHLLEPFFNDFEIIVYLRRQDQLALSSYSTKLKFGSIDKTVFSEKIDSENKYYNYYTLIRRWEEVFGKNMTIRIFDKDQFYSGDLLCDFMHIAGIKPDASFTTPGILNEKLSVEAQYLLLRYNQRYPRFKKDKLQKLNDQVRIEVIQYLENRYKGKPFLPPRKEAQAFYNSFQQVNIRLANTYFNQNELFNQDFDFYPLSESSAALPYIEIKKFDYFVRYHLLKRFIKNKYKSWLKHE